MKMSDLMESSSQDSDDSDSESELGSPKEAALRKADREKAAGLTDSM